MSNLDLDIIEIFSNMTEHISYEFDIETYELIEIVRGYCDKVIDRSKYEVEEKGQEEREKEKINERKRI